MESVKKDKNVLGRFFSGFNLRFKRSQLVIPYGLFLALFVVFPLLIIVYYAFTDRLTGAFTLNNFITFFTDSTAITTFIVSVGISGLTTVACLLIAYPLCYFLARSKMSKKHILLMLFVMPMWINFVLRINALREFLNMLGLLGRANYFNTVLGMVYDYLPFMILPIYTTLIKMDNSLIEAAKDLGANNMTVFFKVTLPLSAPGIISGVTMVFMPTMTSYVISDSLGLGHVTILGKLIENFFGAANNWNMGSAIALVLLGIILVSMLITGQFKDKNLESRGAGLW